MDFASLKDKIVWATGTGLVSWMVFLTYASMTAATHANVSEMIQVESPYVEDRRLIMRQLDDLSVLSKAILDNNKSVQGLRVDIERLSVQQDVMYEKLDNVERKLDGAGN